MSRAARRARRISRALWIGGRRIGGDAPIAIEARLSRLDSPSSLAPLRLVRHGRSAQRELQAAATALLAR